MSPATKSVGAWLKWRINVAKGKMGMRRVQIAAKVATRGRRISASSLMIEKEIRVTLAT
jgi:hypothetical protein